MKNRTSLFVVLTALAHTWLFYEQSSGINYVVLDALLLCLLMMTRIDRFKETSVMLSSIGMLLSAVFVFVHNNSAPIMLHWISFILFIKLFYDPQLSPYFALVEQVWITLCSIFRIFKWKRLLGSSDEPKESNWVLYLATFPIVLVFVLLYSSGNAVYGELLSKLTEFDLDFGVLWFFFLSVVLAFSVFVPFTVVLLKAFDLSCDNTLEPIEEEGTYSSLFGSLGTELNVGCFLLIMLNLVTLSLHVTDVYSLLSPSVFIVNHSANVHQGVNSLIVSIFLAIFIVVYFFRGGANFSSENKTLKVLTYVWLLQNVGLVFSTCHKDILYMLEHGLTHKRIGVMVWLTIVLFGVIYTLLKIHYKRSTWYLLRVNTWTVYVVLLLYSCVHWDRVIVKHNMSCENCQVDYAYLHQLDISAWADINALPLGQKGKMALGLLSSQEKSLERHVAEYELQGWPSFSLENERIAKSLHTQTIHTK